MADEHTENTEPSQSGTSPLDTDVEMTQAGMWTEAPIGTEALDAGAIDDASVSLDDALPPELTPPESAARDRRSDSSATLPIPVVEPSAPRTLPRPSTERAPSSARAGKRERPRETPDVERSVSVEERFPPIRPARGGRLIAFGAIALGTFVVGLVLSSVFSRPGPPPPSPILSAPTSAAALASTAPASTSAPAATPASTPAAIAAAPATTPAAAPTVAPVATPAPKPAPAPAKKAATMAKSAKSKPAASASAARSSKTSPVAARAAGKASRPSSREDALPWEEADPHTGPNSRVIHTLSGNKSVLVNKNVAVTRQNGKTVIGKLVEVKSGTVDVLAKGKHVRIAEGDVKDASNY